MGFECVVKLCFTILLEVLLLADPLWISSSDFPHEDWQRPNMEYRVLTQLVI